MEQRDRDGRRDKGYNFRQSTLEHRGFESACETSTMGEGTSRLATSPGAAGEPLGFVHFCGWHNIGGSAILIEAREQGTRGWCRGERERRC